MTEDEERRAGLELLAIFREWFDDHHLGEVTDFETWLKHAPITATARQAMATAQETAPASPSSRQQQRRASRKERPRQPRYWSAHEAAVMMRRGVDEGHCPGCGAEVETFISRADPDIDGIRFGCRYCCTESAAMIDWAAQMREATAAAREAQHRLN